MNKNNKLQAFVIWKNLTFIFMLLLCYDTRCDETRVLYEEKNGRKQNWDDVGSVLLIKNYSEMTITLSQFEG